MKIFSKFVSKLRRAKGSLALIGFVGLLLISINVIQYLLARSAVREEVEHRAESELNAKRLEIQKVMGGVEIAAHNVAWNLEQALAKSDDVYSDLQRILTNNSYLAGCGIGFTADYYPQHGRWYEPYVERRPDGTYVNKQIGSARHNYLEAEWFTNALVSDSGYWSEPYYDEAGAHARLCTFAYPLRDASGRTVAVLGIDLLLDWLSDVLNVNRVYPTSYNLMISGTGQLLACPTESLVMRSTIQEATRKIEDTTAQFINKQMMSGQNGSASLEAEDGEKYHVYYAPMDHGWSMAVVCPDDEVYGSLNRSTNGLFLLMIVGVSLLGFILNRMGRSYQRIQAINQEKDRIASELHIASSIQMGMLPKVFPPFPNRDDVEVFGSLVSAKEVGGDLYDFYIRDEKLFFCIGDVSGKGVPASLVMAVTRSLFRTVLAHESMPDRIMTTMNDAMTEMNESNMFVTFFIGVLDLPTGRLRYSNAGHCPPVLIGMTKGMLRIEPNIPLGLMDGWKYTCQETMIDPNTTIFLYTDGLTEAENADHAQFGEQRMMEVAQTCVQPKKMMNTTSDKAQASTATPVPNGDATATKSTDPDQAAEKTAATCNAERIVKRMSNAVHDFVDGAEQSDDLTMLAVQYTKKHIVEVLSRTITLHNDVNEVPQLAAFVDDVCEALGFDAPTVMQMNLAMEEAVVNVMNYAYPAGTVGNIRIDAVASEERLKFVITDSGSPFDPTEQAVVDTTLGVDDRPIGGLGIHLVRQLMDSINYERIDGKNILTLRKTYTHPNAAQV